MPSRRKYDEAQLDYTDLQPRNFSRFGLLNNPFPAVPVAADKVRIFVDRLREIKAVEYVTKDAFTTGKTQTLIIEGLYGNGKSCLLKYVRTKINTQLATNEDRKGIAVYVPTPGLFLKDLFAGILSDLGTNFLRSVAYRIIVNKIGSSRLVNYIFDIEKSNFKQIANQVEKDPLLLSRTFSRKAFRVKDLYHDVESEFSVEFPEFLHATLSLADDETLMTAWRWLLGEFLSREERSDIGVVREIEDSDDVLKAFASLRQILKEAGFDVIYVLIDEFEKIAELRGASGAARKSMYFDDIRHLIDQNTKGVCLIACVTPTGTALIQRTGHPLSRRLLGNVEKLSLFGEDETYRLIEDYLRLGREEYESVTGKQLRSSGGIEPFTKRSIKIITSLANGNVSEILRTCKKLLDAAADRKADLIDNAEAVYKLLGIEAPTAT